MVIRGVVGFAISQPGRKLPQKINPIFLQWRSKVEGARNLQESALGGENEWTRRG